ncbi:MAG: aromatic ring-hydroxylating dioxygenase subunit alpha [Paracoccaceae bacterium]|nr:aromatic ring-hydroxylating dioxygenase subunit alpha [Paracoccaceae bacterium]
MEISCKDPVILNQWHPVSSLDVLTMDTVENTILLESKISFQLNSKEEVTAWLSLDDEKTLLPTRISYGFIWVSLGNPPKDLFLFPEFSESDRQNVATGVFGVNVSAGRTVENFLDMGHFPYVHSGILGEEPHTEVKEYDVEISEERDEVLATSCKFYQPQAAVNSNEGMDVDYIYRVPHINCALLYKTSPVDDARLDVIIIFVQPMGEEWVRAHTGMCLIDDESTAEQIRQFQQTIFGQDKPILENQYPKQLPLDSRIETPIRADKSAIAYRRWLSQKGLQYGVIPSAI